ncbi:MAG: hypothetical protein JST19_10560 [Bacteroidetes bacterium]|nr:hypothetical protein [Bacteroidota bacterium]
MVKYLPIVTLCLLIFSTPSYGQSHADSTANRVAPDSNSKPVDTNLIKVKAVAKHLNTDGTAVSDSILRHPTAGTIARTPAASAKAKTNKNRGPHPAVNAAKRSPADTLLHSPVKTLSDERYTMLVRGEDFDHMSLAGELNHYPLPDKALKYKIQIGLNPGQIIQLKAIATGLLRKKMEMGQDIVSNEKKLDTLFKTRQADDGSIIFYTNRYGLYLGEIRNAVLQACYKTEAVLSEAQIKKLEGLLK